MTTTRRKCDVFSLRYVPSVLEERFVNIGVLLVERGGGFTDSRFLLDWKRVQSFDPEADIEMLAALTQEISNICKQPSEGDALIHEMLAYSCAVQLWPEETIVTDNPAEELERRSASLL